MKRVELFPVSEITEENKLYEKVVGMDTIMVFKRNGKFYAFLDNCPHTDSPMGLNCLEGNRIVCPLHGAEFDAETGKVLEPPADEDLKMYEVLVENDRLYIEID